MTRARTGSMSSRCVLLFPSAIQFLDRPLYLQSLTLVDYLLHSGSENVIVYFKDNIYLIKTLREFQYIAEDGRDQGANVRQKARDISNLLLDEARVRQERRSRAQMYQRMSRDRRSSDYDDLDDENSRRRSINSVRRPKKEDEELLRAIEESKRIAAQDKANAEERDLQRAIQLSKEEEEKRARALADASLILFDNQNQIQAPLTSQNNLVDATLPLQIASTGMQPQFTAMAPQFTSFNPFQQQTQQEIMQAQYMQQQAEWMHQQQAFQQAQELQALQQAKLAQAQQEEWLRQQQLLQAQQTQSILAQPTAAHIGSNNPFAPAASQSAPPLSRDAASAGPQSTGSVSFNLTGSYANRDSSASAPPGPRQQQQQQQQQQMTGRVSRADQEHAHLANLFASRGAADGIDTFGNVGQLRFMSTQAGRLVAQKTGAPNHNPFLQQNPTSQQSDQPFFQL
ncbi:hypothetical protein AcV5_005392 [Taiwanofungus camphoratus]|nr:hypothetical protein AcV5_005392 [Antrodia cinnamomea]